jgi:hypothetical protein
MAVGMSIFAVIYHKGVSFTTLYIYILYIFTHTVGILYIYIYTWWPKWLCAPDDYSTKNTQKYFKQFKSLTMITCGPGSSVGIATGYGLDGPGIQSRCGWDFQHLSRPALGTHPSSCTMGTRSFPGVESGRGVTLTPHPLLVPRSKNRVELYLYSPQGPSWPVKRVKCTIITW